MSRVGKQPIPTSSGVKLTVDGRDVTATGPLGKVFVTVPRGVVLTIKDDVTNVTVNIDETDTPGAWGLARALVANAVEGVTSGFKKNLQLIGVGYRVEVKGKDLVLNVGFSHLITVAAPEGISFEVGEAGSMTIQGSSQPSIPFSVSGIDKQLVGQVAASLRSIKKPEPYKGKGIRYADEHVATKAGKSAA